MGLRRTLRLVSGMSEVEAQAAAGVASAPELAAELSVPRVEVGVASPFQPRNLTTIVWAELFDSVNMPTTRAEAMSVPAIAKGRHVLCPKVASTPIRALRGDAEVTPQPTWLYSTADAVSPWHRMLWTVDDLVFYGWSLWACQRGADGFPTAATRVGIDRWKFDGSKVLVDDEPVPDGQVILIPGPHEGVLNYGRTTIRHARQLLSAAAAAGATPNAQTELHQNDPNVELTDPQIQTLIEQWAAARRGENGGVAYSSHSIDVRDHGSIDAQLLVEGRNAAAVDCARILGIAAAMVDATTPKASLTYETTQGRGLEHTAYGIEPYADAIAQRLSLDDVVPRGQRIRFDIADQLTPQPTPTGPVEDD